MNENTKNAAESVSKFVNSLDPDYKGFVETMGSDHPTLQQAFTVLCLSWIKFIAERDDIYFDPRNRASKDICNKIGDFLSTGPDDNYWHRLPMI